MKPKRNYVPGPTDDCMSPPWAVLPILPFLAPTLKIWEPCAGTRNLAKRMHAQGLDVLASDIQTGTDFFDARSFFTARNYRRAIVTNPPWGRKYEFLARCYEIGQPFALLMPVEVQGAEKAQALFRKHGIQVIYTSPRINFSMPDLGWIGAAQMPVAWFTWNLVHKEQSWFDFRPFAEFQEWERKVAKLRWAWVPRIEWKKKYYKDKDIKVSTSQIIAELEQEYPDLPDRFTIE